MKACAMERRYTTCAECTDFQNLKKCKKLYNIVSRFFGFIFHTDRIGNLNRIREEGIEKFKEEKREEFTDWCSKQNFEDIENNKD